MTTYRTSNGERIEKSTIDYRVRKAKAELTKALIGDDLEKICWACGRNGVRLSWSHIISVNDCQKNGLTHLAWDKMNMQQECIEKCHPETERRKIEHHLNFEVKLKFIVKVNQMILND